MGGDLGVECELFVNKIWQKEFFRQGKLMFVKGLHNLVN